MNESCTRRRRIHPARSKLSTAAIASIGALIVAACSGAGEAEFVQTASDGVKTALARKPGKGKPSTPSPPPGGSATVTWVPPTLNTDGSALTDLVGYRIYFGTSQSNLTQFVDAPGSTVTSYVVGGLSTGTYYFAVAAVDSLGEASSLSNAVAVSIP